MASDGSVPGQECDLGHETLHETLFFHRQDSWIELDGVSQRATFLLLLLWRGRSEEIFNAVTYSFLFALVFSFFFTFLFGQDWAWYGRRFLEMGKGE